MRQKKKNLNSSYRYKWRDCFQIDLKFAKLPISIVYRVVEKSDTIKGQSDILYNFIKKSIEKFHPLLHFVDPKILSDENLKDLSEKCPSGSSNMKNFLAYMQFDANYVSDLRDKIKDQLNLIRKNSIKESLNGIIFASVKNGLSIKAKLLISEKTVKIDKNRSKVILSLSGDESEFETRQYENGELITSCNMSFLFGAKSGTYYVRALLIGSDGISREIVSNPVTTNGSCIFFDYTGKADESIKFI